MEHLQRDMAEKSRVTVTLDTRVTSNKDVEALSYEKEALQHELTTLLRRDIELQNELEYFRTKSLALEKQLSDIQSSRDVSMEGYKREITYELNILTNLNEYLVKENDHLKNTIKHHEVQHKDLETRLTHTRL